MRAQGLSDWNWGHGVHRAGLDLCCSHNRPHLRSQGWQRACLRPTVAPSPLFASGGWSFTSLAGTCGNSFTIIFVVFYPGGCGRRSDVYPSFSYSPLSPQTLQRCPSTLRTAHVPRSYRARTAHVPRTYRARTAHAAVPVWQTQATTSLNCDLWGGWRILQILKPSRAQYG